MDMWDKAEFEKWMRAQSVPEPPALMRAQVNTGMWYRFWRWLMGYEEQLSITRGDKDVANRGL